MRRYDPVFKVNPPLRTDRRRRGGRGGLADGTLDAIATDHAPHAPEDKEQPFDQAPPGMLGLETALALALTELDLPIEEQVLALCRGSRRRSPASRPPRRADRRGPPGQPLRHRPGATWVVEPALLGQPQPQHALRRAARSPAGCATRCCGEPVVVDGEAQR